MSAPNESIVAMRILLIHQSFVSHDHPGGTRHYELLSHLQRKGHECTIVAGNIGYLTGQPVVETKKWVHESDEGGIRILRAYVLPALHTSFVWRVVAFLSFMVTSTWGALRSGPTDVVIGTSPPLFQLVSAWITARWKRVPFVLEVRDLWPEFAIDMKVLTNPIVISLARFLENFLYARADRFIVNSPAYEDYLVCKGIARDRIEFISNGVDPAMFEQARDGKSFRSQHGLEKKFVVTYAGALGIANDIGTIVEAAALLQEFDDIAFVLVGSGKEERNLREAVQAKGLTNVTFAGCYAKSEMHDVLAGSDVCLATLQDIPMFRTTYPNKVFDYMAASRPIVLGIEGVIREVVEAADAGIAVHPGSPSELAAAVQRLFEHQEAAKQMGVNGQHYVKKHFRRDHHADTLAMMLEHLVPSARQTSLSDKSH